MVVVVVVVKVVNEGRSWLAAEGDAAVMVVTVVVAVWVGCEMRAGAKSRMALKAPLRRERRS